ncbi:peptidase U32 family protein [Cohnella faecalis]|uniref:U32 family peptidase n=1 Tax=Cohnella faecalis TaxID=2315694 RepID=A0A398CTB9_9BACL|nr:peptidase U32 family protein [Cohnella faecalis]RIE03077.1 U32 family peptidase [Cohnella faecalis]
MGKVTTDTRLELLISAGSAAQADKYLEAGATAILIGESRFGMRLPGEIREDELKEVIALIHERGGKAYVNAGKLFRNEELSALPAYLRSAAAAGADAITFGDPAVLLNAREFAPSLKLHWNAEMTGTNSAAAGYWGRRGAIRAVLARELNEEEIADFKRNVELEVQIQVHGMTNIYHSHRNLLESYLQHIGREATLVERGADKGLFLVEMERPDERFPVYEDANGTHVMSPDDICLLEALPELYAAGVDSLYVEALLKTEEYNETVLRAYREAIDRLVANPDSYKFDERGLNRIRALQHPERELGFGFLYKEQVY